MCQTQRHCQYLVKSACTNAGEFSSLLPIQCSGAQPNCNLKQEGVALHCASPFGLDVIADSSNKPPHVGPSTTFLSFEAFCYAGFGPGRSKFHRRFQRCRKMSFRQLLPAINTNFPLDMADQAELQNLYIQIILQLRKSSPWIRPFQQ